MTAIQKGSCRLELNGKPLTCAVVAYAFAPSAGRTSFNAAIGGDAFGFSGLKLQPDVALSLTCLRTSETLRTYKSRSNALKAAGSRYYDGTAEIHLDQDLWGVRLTYWRIPPRLADEASLTGKDREAAARGLIAPLRPSRAQSTEPMGLFAWEPAHVLMTGRADGLIARP